MNFKTLKALVFIALLALVLCACGPEAVTATEPPVVPTATTAPLPSATLETTMNAHWTFTTGGAIWGTPALDNGMVFIGSDDGTLYAVDAQTGTLKWKFASQGIVRSRPAIAGGRVYFSSDDGSLYALNEADGNKAWSTDIGNFLDRQTRLDLGNSPDPNGYDYLQSSPVVADGTVYVGSLDGKLYAVTADTGTVKWTFSTSKKIRATPTVDNGVVYVGSWDKLTYAVDAAMGEVKWAVGVGGQVQSNALVANGLVYTASRKASVEALDAQTGELKWEHSYGSNLWVESSPSLVNGIIYIGASGNKYVLGLDALSGKPAAIYLSQNFLWSTPLVIRDSLYIGSEGFKPGAGGLISLKMTDGKFTTQNPVQLFTTPDTLEFSGNWNGVAGSPVTENNLIYFGALDGKLYAVNALP